MLTKRDMLKCDGGVMSNLRAEFRLLIHIWLAICSVLQTAVETNPAFIQMVACRIAEWQVDAVADWPKRVQNR